MPYQILGNIGTLDMANNASTNNACCILTLDNVVMLMGNVELSDYTAGEVICTLADQMMPTYEVRTVVCLDDDLVALTVNAYGELSLNVDCASGTLYLNGVLFNVCDTYYNDEIGNNFLQGTSPLR